MAARRSEKRLGKHAGCGVCAHSVVDDLSRVGMGDKGQRASILVSETLWIGDRTEWPHSPGDAEGGGKCHFPHCHVDRLSSTGTRNGTISRADESPSRKTQNRAGPGRCAL